MTKIFDVQGNLLGDTGGPAQPVPFPEVVDVPATLVNGLLASSATVGDILTVTTGNWQNMGDEGPKNYAYQWWKFDRGKLHSIMAGRVLPEYEVVAGDCGWEICAVLTATNYWGRTTSPPSNSVKIAGTRSPPAHNRPPISG